MKQMKNFLVVLLFIPSFVFGGIIEDNLAFINEQFAKYNKYESEFDVSGNQLVFKNKFNTAYIPFRDIDFRINYKHNSIDIYCIDGSKCIEKGNDNWEYYNVSMIDGSRIAKVIFETLDKCREIRSLIVKKEKKAYYGSSEADLLRYINRQFDLYNQYNSRFEVDNDNGQLVFSNRFGTSKIKFSNIVFKLNTSAKSVEFHCKDGSKCIARYDFDGKESTWNYYNVSLVTESDEMADEAYKVKEKCDQLQAKYVSEDEGADDYNKDDAYDGDGSVDDLLAYINRQFKNYNKYGSQFKVNKRNQTLIFSNEMSTAEPIPFENIGFRLDNKHKSIDIYCIDGSECIYKGSEWEYYNISLINSKEEMADVIHTVMEKCRELKSLVLNGGEIVDNNQKVKKNTGSTEGNRDDNRVKNSKSKALTYLSDINSWYKNNGKAAYIWEIDWTKKQLVYSYDNCKCYIPLENTTIRYEYVKSQGNEPYGVDFLTKGEKYLYDCEDGYNNSGEELNTYVNQKSIADDCIEAFERIQNLVLYGHE